MGIKIYLAKHGGDKITAIQHPGYNNFLAAVKGGPQPLRYMEDPIPEEIDIRAEAGSKKTSGKGYVRRSGVDSSVTCPGNILSDISRLEAHVGGARAANNSVEIINEAADICRRLLAGGIMGVDVYPELIAELVENYRDGYYSD